MGVIRFWISTSVHLCEQKTTTARACPREDQLERPADGLGKTMTFPFWKQTFEEITNQIQALTNTAKKGHDKIREVHSQP